MFGRGADAASSDRHAQSVLQEGITIKGTIEAMGDVRLDGRLEGGLSATERVTIGASGVLEANIEANEVVVMGTVEGRIRARKRLELKKGAKVIGDVATPQLVIEEGVLFHGNSNMRADSEPSSFLGTVEGRLAGESRDEGTYQKVYP